MVKEIFATVPVMLLLTIGAYLLGVWVRRKFGLSILHPFLISIPVILAVIRVLDISPEFYQESNCLIDFMLGPSVVALGYLLYQHRQTIREQMLGIMSAVVVGSVVGLVSVCALCELFGLSDLFILSMEPKSVTIPVAVDITKTIGGNVSLAVASVLVSGFTGAVIGPWVLKLLRIKDPVAKGLAIGCSAHGLGTARAIELGAVEGAVSGLSIALMGVATAIFAPLLNLILGL